MSTNCGQLIAMAIIGLIPVVTIFWIYKGFKRDTLCPFFIIPVLPRYWSIRFNFM